LASHHGVQELDRLTSRYSTAGSLISAKPSIVAQAAVSLSDKPTGTARQRQAQQVSAAVERTLALDRLGLSGKAVKIESGGKPPQHFVELIRRERCCVLHLPQDHTDPRQIKS